MPQTGQTIFPVTFHVGVPPIDVETLCHSIPSFAIEDQMV